MTASLEKHVLEGAVTVLVHLRDHWEGEGDYTFKVCPKLDPDKMALSRYGPQEFEGENYQEFKAAVVLNQVINILQDIRGRSYLDLVTDLLHLLDDGDVAQARGKAMDILTRSQIHTTLGQLEEVAQSTASMSPEFWQRFRDHLVEGKAAIDRGDWNQG